MSVSIKNSQFAKDGIHVTYSDNSSQNITFNNKLLTLDKALSVVGSAEVAGGLTSSANTSLNTVNISGDTVSSGKLNVAGLTTLTNNLNVSGPTSLGNNLTVTGASSVSGNASVGGVLTVTGISNLNNKLNVSDDVKMEKQLTVVGASYLSTLNSTGDASVGGQLNVTSIANLGNNLNVSGDASVVGKLDVTKSVAVTQNATVGGTLTATGASTLNSSLTVAGAATLSNNLSVVGTSNLAVLNVSEDATLSKKLDVTGDTKLRKNLNVNGISNLSNLLNVSGATTINNTLNVSGLSSLGGNVDVGGKLTVDPMGLDTSIFGGKVTMDKDLVVSGNLDVTGTSSFGAKVSAHSAEITNGLTVNGASVFNGSLTANSDVNFNQNVTVGGNLTVLGQTTSIQTTSLEVKDSAILIADGNETDLIDTGFDIQYKPDGASAPLYSGLKRRAGTGEFVLFKDAANKIDGVVPPTEVLGEYFQFDVGTAKSVSTYKIHPNSDSNQLLNSWYLLGSNDNSSWDQVDFKENQNLTSTSTSAVQTLSSPSVNYRYWRFVLKNYKLGTTYFKYGIRLYMKDQNGNNFGSVNVSSSINEEGGSLASQGESTFDGINTTIPGAYDSNGNYVGSVSTFVGAIVVDNYAVLIADSFNCASDMNLKKNVVPLDGALDKIDHIRGVYHDWIDEKNDEHAIGVIAQEVEAVYPELVRHGADGYLSVNYPKLTAVLLQALKELKALVLSKQ